MGNKAAQRAHRRRIREWVKDPATKLGGNWYASSVPPEKHKRSGTYNNWFCRCPPCTGAATTTKKQERRQRWEERVRIVTEEEPKGYWYAPNAPGHGLYSTLRNWGCHCPPCRSAEKTVQESR